MYLQRVLYKKGCICKRNHVCLPCDLSESHFTGLPSHQSFVIARSGKVTDKSQSSALSIAYDTGQFFLVYIYIPDGNLLYYI